MADWASPADLYRAVPEMTTRDVDELIGCYYNHVPELGNIGDGNTRVEIRVIAHVDYDFRRYWRLATVWLDDRPVMVIQNAGREGDDHHARFVTDMAAYAEMIGYLASLSTHLTHETGIDPNAPRADLLAFYGAAIAASSLVEESDSE